MSSLGIIGLYGGDDFWDFVQNGGGDIRITTDDGITECPREIVCDTTTKTGEVHALIPSVSASVDTIIYVYYGNPSASDYDPTDTYGSQAVWSDYNVVFHFENNTDDSSGKSTDITINGIPTYENGKFGKGISLNEIGDYITALGVFPDYAVNNYHISTWIKHDSIVTTNVYAEQQGVIAAYPSGSANVYLSLRNSQYHYRNISASPLYDTTRGTAQTAGSFRKIDGKIIGNDCYLSKSNIWGPPGALSNNKVDLSNTGLAVGKLMNATDTFIGIIDELRIRKNYVSDNFATTEYNNQNDPGSFYTAQSMEQRHRSPFPSNFSLIR